MATRRDDYTNPGNAVERPGLEWFAYIGRLTPRGDSGSEGFNVIDWRRQADRQST